MSRQQSGEVSDGARISFPSDRIHRANVPRWNATIARKNQDLAIPSHPRPDFCRLDRNRGPNSPGANACRSFQICGIDGEQGGHSRKARNVALARGSWDAGLHLRYRRPHPVGLIYRALFGLPDVLPSSDTVTLPFLRDPDFELSVRTDISMASSALRNSEWKAATVLAGSVIEALLLWELKNPHHEPIPKIRNSPPDDWYLSDYIKAAKKLRCVKNETITDVEKAQDYPT